MNFCGSPSDMVYSTPRCRILPLPDHQVAVLIDGAERTRWHFGPQYPRPFFYPLNGPSGVTLTRMGHPGAPNHDHHRSVWFAHHKVLGIDFWSDQTAARIRQKEWLVYEDGDDEARLAVRLGWYDGHNPEELLEQDLIALVRPGPQGETFLELQSTFRPRAESLEFGQTNFGFLAVRVAKSVSAHFGGGTLTDSEGRSGEPAIFGRQARWMDYSGPVDGLERGAAALVEGITYFDHPANPGHPQHWHVREDGWMGAAVCLDRPVTTTRAEPLALRFLLHAHRGGLDAARADEIAREFSGWPRYEVGRSNARHRQYELRVAG
ncbi:MAG TPA: PmoA family protein [Planctomycetaceae bacterium]|nr:PmoA family protein [Planctomycetaceae bacterium]